MKRRPKRKRPIEKMVYVLKPFMIYTIVKTLGMMIFSTIFNELFNEEIRMTFASVVNGLASIFAVAFVMKDFLIEVAIVGEIDIDANGFVRFFSWIKNGLLENRKRIISLLAISGLAVSSALTFNILIEMFSVSTTKYENVETIQYSIPVWLGVILYGIVSPWVEEIVFRGLTYNRMRRYYSAPFCIIATALMFGIFHANIPQFIYGTLMGVLMALVYELTKTFEAPLLFHIVANVFVYMFSTAAGGSSILLSPVYCVIFALISAAFVFVVIKYEGKLRK